MRRTRVVGAVAAGVVAIVLADVASAQFLGGGVRDRIAAARASDFPAKGSLSTAEYRTRVFAGGKREYLIQPARGSSRHPVVIVLHGGNSDNKTD